MNNDPRKNLPKLTAFGIELFTKWVQDLRNPPPGIVQGVRRLRSHRDDLICDCCLGRLCDIAKVDWTRDDNGNVTANYRDTRNSIVTPAGLVAHLFLNAGHAGYYVSVNIPLGLYKNYEVTPGRCNCAFLNDSLNCTYAEIADVIEWAYLDGKQPDFYQPLPPESQEHTGQ